MIESFIVVFCPLDANKISKTTQLIEIMLFPMTFPANKRCLSLSLLLLAQLLCPMTGSFCCSDFVDEIDDALVGDAAVGLQPHLTGAAIAVAHLDAVLLELTAQLPEGPAVNLGVGPPTVAGKGAAAHALGQEDMVAAQACQPYHRLHQSHLAGGAGDVQGDAAVGGREHEPVAQVFPDELHGLVEWHARDALPHAVQAGTLVTHDRIFALLAGLPQRLA